MQEGIAFASVPKWVSPWWAAAAASRAGQSATRCCCTRLSHNPPTLARRPAPSVVQPPRSRRCNALALIPPRTGRYSWNQSSGQPCPGVWGCCRSVTPTTKTVGAAIGASTGGGLRLASSRSPKKKTPASNSQAAGRLRINGGGERALGVAARTNPDARRSALGRSGFRPTVARRQSPQWRRRVRARFLPPATIRSARVKG
jgi:hypothetical protein